MAAGGGMSRGTLGGMPVRAISKNQPPERIAGILADINALILLHDERVDVDA